MLKGTASDELIIVTGYDEWNKSRVIIATDGSFIRRFGAGKLIGPKGLAVTPRGTVLVADNKGNRLLEFSMKGRIIRQIPAPGADKVRRRSLTLT